MGCSSGLQEEPDLSVPLDSLSFSAPTSSGEVEYNQIDEASGLAVSRSKPDALWTHNDSGGKNELYLLSNQGKHLGIFTLAKAENEDWEEIAIGLGPEEGKHYLYVADMGDNRAVRKVKTIYRFPEPDLRNLKFPVKEKIKNIDKIRYQYPDGARDAETLIVDPLTKDWIIVSKREDSVQVYRAAYPQSTKEIITLEKLGKLHFSQAIAGDISEDGLEILIKNYPNIYYWKRQANEQVSDALQRAPVRLPYQMEPQGEAIAWKPDGSGYYTLSEEKDGVEAVLYYYKRLESK